MRVSRRKFLAGALAAAGAQALPRASLAKVRRAGPRYVVQIQLSGGLDAILSTSPKQKGEVEKGIDLPYAAHEIVRSHGLELGPTFKGLADECKNLTILNSVRVDTVSHPSACTMLYRMQRDAVPDMPPVMAILGKYRDDQPLPWMALNVIPQAYGAGFGELTDQIVTYAGKRDPDLDRASKALREWSAKSAGGHDARDAAVGASMKEASELLARLPSVTPLVVEKWGDGMGGTGELLQKTAWILENNLCRGLLVKFGFERWDTHDNNLAGQTRFSSNFCENFARFAKLLRERRNEHGTLWDNTLIVLSGEFGRFPYLNANNGKDHFPEMDVVFTGGAMPARTTGRRFGGTGIEMQGLPINPKTGALDKRGSQPVLEDVGSSVLAFCGIDPELYGYNGTVYDFLFS